MVNSLTLWTKYFKKCNIWIDSKRGIFWLHFSIIAATNWTESCLGMPWQTMIDNDILLCEKRNWLLQIVTTNDKSDFKDGPPQSIIIITPVIRFMYKVKLQQTLRFILLPLKFFDLVIDMVRGIILISQLILHILHLLLNFSEDLL